MEYIRMTHHSIVYHSRVEFNHELGAAINFLD